MSDKLLKGQWPGGARLALSLVVNVEEGAELNIRDGDRGPDPVDELGIVLRKPVRNFGNESNYAYGINEGGPRILRLLDQFRCRATFAAAAVALQRAPDLARAIVAGGHEVCAHGYRWAAQAGMDEAREREFIAQATASIQATTGKRPLGWLSRYLHTASTRQLLAEAGYQYHMDDYSRDEPFWDTSTTPPMVVLPYALDSNDMKMWQQAALTPARWGQYARDTLDCLYSESANMTRMMSLGVHLRIIGRPGRVGALEAFLRYASSLPGVWLATRAELAAHFRATVSAPAR